MVYFCHARIPDYVIKPAAVEAARPFKDEKKSVACSCTESDRCEEEERSEEEDNVVENPGALRVTTRANVPYNLEGYTKNAMLMMSRAAQHPMIFYEDDIREKMIRVTEVFENFRFEIIQHVNLTDDQIDQRCQDFFRRDFTDYGCVAVVFFKADYSKYLLKKAQEGLFADVIVRHYNTNGNPTLRGKPKLYINESSLFFKKSASYCSSLDTINQSDVLCLHIPTISPSHVLRQPLDILCSKLAIKADDDLMAIILEFMEQSEPTFRAYMYVTSTLTKNLFLPRRNEVEHN